MGTSGTLVQSPQLLADFKIKIDRLPERIASARLAAGLRSGWRRHGGGGAGGSSAGRALAAPGGQPHRPALRKEATHQFRQIHDQVVIILIIID